MAVRWVGQNSDPIFRRLWSKVHRVCQCGSVRSLQRRFLIDDVLLRSGDIRDQVAKLCEIARNFDVFWTAKFRGKGATRIFDRILQIWVTIEHVAKFADDRPSDVWV